METRSNSGKWKEMGGADGLGVHLVFDVQDHTEKGLEKVEHGLEALEEAHEGVGHAAEAASHQVLGLQNAFEHMQHTGHQIMEVGERGLQSFEGMAHHAIHAAAEFDELRAKMQFAFGEETQRAFSNLRTFEQNSAYSMAELTEAVAALRSAFRGIDPTDLTPRFRSATGQMESGLEALSDAAAGAGVSLGDTIQIVERALEGNYQSIAYQMRLSGEEVDAMRGRVNAAGTEQEKYNAIVETLAQHWGGAQRTMGGTFAMLETRLRSITHLLWAEVGEKGLEPIKELMDELHAMFRGMLSDREFIETLASAFRMVTAVVRDAGRYVIKLVEATKDWIKENPEMTKFLVTVWAVGSALLVVVGKVISLGGSLGMASLAMKTLGVTVGGVLLALGKALLVIVAVGAAISLLWGGVKRIWERDFAGIRTFLERVGWVLRGLYEAFQHWGDSTTEISEETARGLHQAGILDWFIEAVAWASRAQKWFQGVWKALQDGWEEARPSLMRAWDELSTSFQQAWDTIRGALAQAGFLQSAVNTSFKESKESGSRFGQILNSVIVPSIKLFAESLKAVAWVVREVVIPLAMHMIHYWGRVRDFFTNTDDGQAIITAFRVMARIVGINLRGAFLAAKVVIYGVMGALHAIAWVINTVFIEPVREVIAAVRQLYDKFVEFDNWLSGGRIVRTLKKIADLIKLIFFTTGEINGRQFLFGFDVSEDERETPGAERMTEDEEREELTDRRQPRGRSFDSYVARTRDEQEKILLSDSQALEGKDSAADQNTRLLASVASMTDEIKRTNRILLDNKAPPMAVTDEQIAVSAMQGQQERTTRFGRLGRGGE